MPPDGNDDIDARRRRDLAAFLRAKRAALKPADFGLSNSGRRRVAGLRREELAHISGIGVTWYTWLEQGRNIHVSTDLLQRLARTLRLSPHDAAYLFSLAGQSPTALAKQDSRLIDGLQAVLDGYTSGPAFASDVVGNTLAFNRIGDLVYHFNGYEGTWGDNIYWRLFMDPYRRQMYVDWPDFARFAIGLMRGLYASRKDDFAYNKMIEDLCRSNPGFRRMWNQSAQLGASSYVPSQVRLRAPGFGTLNFLSLRLDVPMADARAAFLAPQNEATRRAVLKMGSR